jgi:hypothetical protein
MEGLTLDLSQSMLDVSTKKVAITDYSSKDHQAALVDQ